MHITLNVLIFMEHIGGARLPLSKHWGGGGGGGRGAVAPPTPPFPTPMNKGDK